jgi:hypothetical protein
MTSEVALLNKSCIALAADSATTVSYWEKGEPKTRYFKGANKIFNLSGTHPVGLMTYASASLQGVPWEIIVKAYRENIKSKSHDELHGYSQDFFDFIATSAHIFPDVIQEEQFRTQTDRVASNIVLPIFLDETFKNAADDAARAAVFTTLFAQRTAQVAGAVFLSGATQADADSAIARFAGQVQHMLEGDKWYDKVPRGAMAELSRLAILGIYKEDFTGLQSTGLAFAGYGDKEYFPRMSVYRCSGMVLGKLLCAKESEVIISQENASDLVPLAMSEMIGTFVWGIGDSGINQIVSSFRTQASALIEAIRGAGHIPVGVDINSFVEDAARKHLKELMRKLHESHQAPLQRVIGSLPFSEMAELAEALVFMESMKERVTTPAESVSGPIDVAVISKGDGFVWIKRKHYFDPKLNPRFFARHSVA